MKKILIMFILSLLAVTGSAYAKSTEMVKEIDDLKVKIRMDMEMHGKSSHRTSGSETHHHAMGKNKLDIFISDHNETPVTDAKVKVKYAMPPMGNMPPMNYTARAKKDDDHYNANVNFTMEGNWDVIIYIKRPQKKLTKVDFSVDVK